MFDIRFIILLLAFLLVIFLSIRFIFKRRKDFTEHEAFESENEVHDYENATKLFEETSNKEDEGDDIRDIYNKKNKKQKNYQPKSYRGADIEVTASESKKDLKDLKRDDLNTIDLEDLQEVIEEERKEERKEEEEDRIKKTSREANIDEIGENYRATGGFSDKDNFKATAKAAKASNEKNNNSISR